VVGCDPHAIFDLDDRLLRMGAENTGHLAFAFWIEMQHKDEATTAAGRHGIEEPAQGLDTTRGGADADDWDRGCLGVLELSASAESVRSERSVGRPIFPLDRFAIGFRRCRIMAAKLRTRSARYNRRTDIACSQSMRDMPVETNALELHNKLPLTPDLAFAFGQMLFGLGKVLFYHCAVHHS
jgi:hypothetical protein